jgi:hypothetical protein
MQGKTIKTKELFIIVTSSSTVGCQVKGRQQRNQRRLK